VYDCEIVGSFGCLNINKYIYKVVILSRRVGLFLTKGL